MKKAYIFLAEGFEEVEALTPLDLLRRAGIEAKFISISQKIEVTGSHNITILADDLFESLDLTNGDIFILPGGQPGTNNLKAHSDLRNLIENMAKKDKIICAICAGPSILGELGLLKGKNATVYPGLEDKLIGAKVSNESLNVDGNIITARSLASATEFSLAIIEKAIGLEIKEKIKTEIVM